MKRIIAIFLSFIFVFMFISCTKNESLNLTESSFAYSESLTAYSEKITVSTGSDYKNKTTTYTEKETDKKFIPATTELCLEQTVLSYEETVTQSDIRTCTISINCKTILKNTDKLKKGKESFVPADGIILEEVNVEFEQGETVFDVLKRVCAQKRCADECEYCLKNGIHLESSYTPAFDNYYIEGIHQIYEKDCGSKSGWMYKVNGEFPNYGCSAYILENGDKIEWVYTCDLGEDTE